MSFENTTKLAFSFRNKIYNFIHVNSLPDDNVVDSNSFELFLPQSILDDIIKLQKKVEKL